MHPLWKADNIVRLPVPSDVEVIGETTKLVGEIGRNHILWKVTEICGPNDVGEDSVPTLLLSGVVAFRKGNERLQG